jgi:hypothetical protein
MFPLVHIYAATQVSKRKTPLLVTGSVLPDFVWIDRKTFLPEKLHDNIDDFFAFLEKNNEDMLDLALGMKLHSNDIGADKYSHFYNGGYSYKKGKILIPDLIKLIGPNEDKKISGVSHNFIEAALDLHLQIDKPELLDLYKNSLAQVNLSDISKVISGYSKIKYEAVFKSIQMLLELVKPENLVSDRLMAENVMPTMIKASIGKEAVIDNEGILNILQKAVEVTRTDYKELFNEMIDLMKKDFYF